MSISSFDFDPLSFLKSDYSSSNNQYYYNKSYYTTFPSSTSADPNPSIGLNTDSLYVALKTLKIHLKPLAEPEPINQTIFLFDPEELVI